MSEHAHISGATRLIGLIGNPVRNSHGPIVHNAVFEKMGYNYAYVAHEVDNVFLADAVRGMAALGYLGYNVTTPCKTQILPYLDEISEVAEIMGAVNTVVIQKGRSLGDNCDGAAFMRNLVFSGVNIRGKKITVVGAGGAGSAIAAQAALDGVAAIDIFNQKDAFYSSAESFVERLRVHVPDCKVNLYQLDDEIQLRASLSQSALLAHATTVGSIDHPGCLFAKDMLPKDMVVAESVYLPRETELLKMARENGNPIIDGVGPFLQQAAISERLWIGREMPVDYIRERFFSE